MTANEPSGLGTLGIKLFIASLTFIFGATIVLYAILMSQQKPPPVGVLPVVRAGLLVSTGVILLSSLTLWLATRAIARDDRAGCSRWVTATLGLGIGFIISQSINWWQVVDAGLALDMANRHAAFFVLLTVLHAVHVLGGLVRLIPVTLAARRGRYTQSEHEPVTNVALYWHFLDAVWLVMLAAIFALSS